MGEIFISYSRRDSQFVDSLMRQIEQNDLDIWMDREDIRGGDSFRAAISQAIRNCPLLIVVLSPDSIASKYVTQEVTVADQNDKPIIPVLYRQCQIPPEMELQLAGIHLVDFSIQPFNTALNQLLQALRSGRGVQTRPPSSQTERRDLTLPQLLPGVWQVQLSVPTPFGVMPGQMAIEIFPNGYFRGQSPVVAAEGQWQISQFNQLFLSGTQTNGFQMAPYQVLVQFTQVSHNQLNGITSGNEMAFWQRIR